jgi:ketosteroid isomerase-like protein
MVTQADESTVRALMGEISQAFLKRDVATLDAIFDETFTLTDPYGEVVGKEEWLADVASGALAIESVESEDFDIRPVGDAFRVKGRLRLRAKYAKANYNGTFAYMGVYTKHADGWKLTLSSARRAPLTDTAAARPPN